MKQFLLFSLFILSTCSLLAQSAEKTPGCLDSLDIPTSFTPNGDSTNDDFSIYFPCQPEKFEIAIFNRWGVEIFSSKEYAFRWTGSTSKGEEMPTGVYFFSMTFTYLDEEKTITGNVTLIR